ncbi:MAG: hypothetical protein MJ132_01695 [Clostridia bacterium]|nr:hypothetical protein [Clostridia bacterium]
MKRALGILLAICMLLSVCVVGVPVSAENTSGKMLKCLLGTSSDTSKTHYGQFRTPKFSVQSGKTYDVSFDYYLDGAVAGGYDNATNCAQNYVRIYSDKGYLTTTNMLDASNENLNYFTPGLHHFTASFKASRNEATARILIRQLYNGTLYYSDFTVVEQGTTTNLLSNGDFSNGLTGYYYVGGGEQGEFGQAATGVWATVYEVVDYGQPIGEPAAPVEPEKPEEPSGDGICAHEYGKDGICTKCSETIPAWHLVSAENGAGDGKFLTDAFDGLPLNQTYTLKMKFFLISGGFYVQEIYDELNTSGTRHDGNQLMNEPVPSGEIIEREFTVTPQNLPNEYTAAVRNRQGKNDYYVWDIQVYTESGTLVAHGPDMRALYTPAHVTNTNITFAEIPLPDDSKEPAWHITANGAAGGNGKLVADVFDDVVAGQDYTLKFNYIAASGSYNAYLNPSTNSEPGNQESQIPGAVFNKIGSVQEYSIPFTAIKDKMKICIRDVGKEGDITDIYFWHICLYDSNDELLAKAKSFKNDAYTSTIATKMYYDDIPFEELEAISVIKYAYKFDFTNTAETEKWPGNYFFVDYSVNATDTIEVRFKYYNVQMPGFKTETIATNTAGGNYTDATPIEYGEGEYHGVVPLTAGHAWTLTIQQNIPEDSGNGRGIVYIWDVEYSLNGGEYQSVDVFGYSPQGGDNRPTITKVPVDQVPKGCVHSYNDKGMCTICGEYIPVVKAEFATDTELKLGQIEADGTATVSFDYYMTAADSYPTVLGETLQPGKHSFTYTGATTGTFEPVISGNSGTLYLWNIEIAVDDTSFDFNTAGSTASRVSALYNAISFVKGDANNDAATDVRDVVRMKKAIADSSVTFDMLTGDLNKNKKADVNDLSDIVKIILGKFYQKYTEAQKEAYLNKAHYAIAGSPEDPDNYVYQLGGKDECGIYVREILIDNGNPDDDENVVDIVELNDVHINTYNDRDLEEANPALMSTIQNRDWPNLDLSLRNLDKSLEYGGYFDQIVVNGDIIDYLSWGALEVMREKIWNPYEGILCTLGNHEATRQMQGTVSDPTTMDSRMQILQDNWDHDIYYTSKVVKGKVMVIQMADGNGTFYKYQIPKLNADLATARENGYTVLVFFHIAIGTNEPANTTHTALFEVPGETSLRNFTGLIPGGQKDANGVGHYALYSDTNAETREVYDILTNNGDVIKGFFSAHTHNAYTLPVYAKTPDGEDVIIPQYVNGAIPYSMNNGQVLRITVR